MNIVKMSPVGKGGRLAVFDENGKDGPSFGMPTLL